MPISFSTLIGKTSERHLQGSTRKRGGMSDQRNRKTLSGNKPTEGMGKQLLVRGDWAPDFVLPQQSGTPTRFYGWAGGRSTVLFFYARHRSTASLDTLVWLWQALTICVPDEISIFAINQDAPFVNEQNAVKRGISIPILSDTKGSVGASYGVDPSGTMTIFVLGPNLRVLDVHHLSDREGALQRILSTLKAIPQCEPVGVVMQAPVLLVPELLERDFCERLIEVWRTQGNVETGVEHSRVGHRADTLMSDTKRRRDHIVTDGELLRTLTFRVGRRLMPELHKAFSFRATRFEGFKIACYDAATGGFFRAHRDNLSPSTAHRRFALTLNLNAGYEGGHLRFPEYGPHLYRPGTGGAIVFSGALLHEALAVTRGQRFVLLSFLFREEDFRTSRRPAHAGRGAERSQG